jgi:beta-glucosidase/6-phospho-beta-glucosidase/beta-galactosidase
LDWRRRLRQLPSFSGRHRYHEADEFSQLSLLIAWPRIQPSGSGASHQKGIDFYKRLTDAVLGAGMRPLVTFFHWDLPQILEDRGGWPNRDTAARLVDYVEIVIFNNVWFLETALRGRYPEAFVHGTALETMGFQTGDEKRMIAPLDYIGVNYYFRRLVSASTTAAPSKVSYDAMAFAPAIGKDGPLIEIGWEVHPRGLYDIVRRVSKDYKLPIEITENGCSYGLP